MDKDLSKVQPISDCLTLMPLVEQGSVAPIPIDGCESDMLVSKIVIGNLKHTYTGTNITLKKMIMSHN